MVPRASRETSSQMVFNVKSYGAVGDGVVDDRDAIAAAMDAANAANGGIVFVPKGRYRIDSELPVLGENVTLRGETSTNAFYTDGTFFETYVEDTVLYFGKFDDANVSTYNVVEHISFRRMIDTAIAFETTVTDATNASPIVVETSAAHPYATGHTVIV